MQVYLILVAQLCVTLLFIAGFLYIPAVRRWSERNPWLWILAFIATLVCLVVLACCPHVRRSFPSNFLFLGVFTLCESFLLGAVAACYQAEAVLTAVGVTACVVLALTLFALQTKCALLSYQHCLICLK